MEDKNEELKNEELPQEETQPEETEASEDRPKLEGEEDNPAAEERTEGEVEQTESLREEVKLDINDPAHGNLTDEERNKL